MGGGNTGLSIAFFIDCFLVLFITGRVHPWTIHAGPSSRRGRPSSNRAKGHNECFPPDFQNKKWQRLSGNAAFIRRWVNWRIYFILIVLK